MNSSLHSNTVITAQLGAKQIALCLWPIWICNILVCHCCQAKSHWSQWCKSLFQVKGILHLTNNMQWNNCPSCSLNNTLILQCTRVKTVFFLHSKYGTYSHNLVLHANNSITGMLSEHCWNLLPSLVFEKCMKTVDLRQISNGQISISLNH